MLNPKSTTALPPARPQQPIPEAEAAGGRQPSQEARVVLLAEMSDQQFQMWRHHPVTSLVLGFLADYAGGLEKEVLTRWRSGSLRLGDEQEARGRVLALAEVAALDVAAIRQFYGQAAP